MQSDDPTVYPVRVYRKRLWQNATPFGLPPSVLGFLAAGVALLLCDVIGIIITPTLSVTLTLIFIALAELAFLRRRIACKKAAENWQRQDIYFLANAHNLPLSKIKVVPPKTVHRQTLHPTR